MKNKCLPVTQNTCDDNLSYKQGILMITFNDNYLTMPVSLKRMVKIFKGKKGNKINYLRNKRSDKFVYIKQTEKIKYF